MVARELSDGPSFAGQQSVILTLPAAATSGYTTVTTGVLQTSIALDSSHLNGFATRFGSTFDEYRILGVNVKIRPISPATGVTRYFFNEKNGTVPSTVDAYERVGLTLSNSNANSSSTRTMSWRARDLLDLQYTPIGTNFTPVWLKIYTDLDTFGAPAVATPISYLEVDFLVEFRGLQAA